MDISRIPAASSADWVNSILNTDSVLGLRPSSVPLFILHAALLCDNLWLARNKATHENHTVDIAELRSSLGFRCAEPSLAWASCANCLSATWLPPKPGWMKINFDVAIRHNGSYITISCRDSSNSLGVHGAIFGCGPISV